LVIKLLLHGDTAPCFYGDLIAQGQPALFEYYPANPVCAFHRFPIHACHAQMFLDYWPVIAATLRDAECRFSKGVY